jgi:small subunit ribosomal protein S13
VYILGTNLIPTKPVRIALTQIFGLGPKKAVLVCYKVGLCDTIKVNQLTKSKLDRLIKIITQNEYIDSELRRLLDKDIKRLINIGCYRGYRHNDGLPLRGQRTHTNAKTCRKHKRLATSLINKRL